MNSDQIRSILRMGTYPDVQGKAVLKETHISWVILTRNYAFKIKKPVRFSFLDFSTLALRKYYCYRELELNTRLAPGMYLDVVPVRKSGSQIIIGGKEGKIIDYAVKMKRLRESREMQRMLESGDINTTHVQRIADVIVQFHRNTQIITSPFDPEAMKVRFNDIESTLPLAKHLAGARGQAIIRNAVKHSDAFINKHNATFRQRVEDHFIRDCHGDLHSGNIFIYRKPVIFDCIEFNDNFRHIDVLEENAFFCMDLEYYQREDLSEEFLRHYIHQFEVIRYAEEELLFQYYKLFRANIKVKVNLLKTDQASDAEEKERRATLARRYLGMMTEYLDRLL